jgi:hypothetical protein
MFLGKVNCLIFRYSEVPITFVHPLGFSTALIELLKPVPVHDLWTLRFFAFCEVLSYPYTENRHQGKYIDSFHVILYIIHPL